MEELAIATVGITAVLFVFKLSEYFEVEVNKAKARLEELQNTPSQNNSISKAIEAQKWVFRCYAGRKQRLILVWLPAFILIIAFILLLLEPVLNFYLGWRLCWGWVVFYSVAILIPTIGAAIGMSKRPIASYQEIILPNCQK